MRLAAEPERQCAKAEDRFMAARSQCRTSLLGRYQPSLAIDLAVAQSKPSTQFDIERQIEFELFHLLQA
jgi:hypothetical protein